MFKSFTDRMKMRAIKFLSLPGLTGQSSITAASYC
jgi:hypothetical protein